MIDNVLVFGRKREQHDKRLSETLGGLRPAGLSPNKEKCKVLACEMSSACASWLLEMVYLARPS